MPANLASRIDPETWESLREIQSPDDPDFLQRLVHVFITASDGFIASLSNESTKTDPKKVKDLAHCWKSSSYGIGAKDLGDLCLALEALAAGQPAEQLRLVEAIRAEYILVRADLLKK